MNGEVGTVDGGGSNCPDEEQSLQVNGPLCDWHEALEVVMGYAFAEVDLDWRRAPSFVGPDVTGAVPRWAYRTYDCVPVGDGCGLTDVDVLVANAINAQMGGAVIAGMRAVSGELSPHIESLDELGLAFWDLEEPELTEQPDKDDRAWPLWRGWSIVEGVPGASIAVTHKVLHHKRPSVFPLLDNKTHAELGGGTDAWLLIHRDLRATAAGWEALERCFAAEAARRKGVCLTRLRLHDILLWAQAVGDWDRCRDAAPPHSAGCSGRGPG